MYNVSEIKEKLSPILKKYKVKKAIVFGSVAKNTATEKSDIDIFVDSGLKGISFFGLLDDIVNAVDANVDLIDKSQIDIGSDIEKEIERTGRVIYG